MSHPPAVVQTGHTSHVWAGYVSCCATDPARTYPAALPLVRAFAADGPDGAALQLRYRTGPHAGLPVLIGRGRTAEDAEALARLVELSLPAGHVLHTVHDHELPDLLVPFGLDEVGPSHVAEIRRVADVAEDGRSVLLAWPSEDTTGELEPLLERVVDETLVCLHLERATVDADLVAQLHGTVRDLLDDLDATADPTRVRALAAHRAWIRELPRAAVRLRVTLVGAAPLPPGLPDLVGLTIAGARPGESGLTYETVRPRTRQEVDLAVQVVDDLRSGAWGSSDDPELDAIRTVFCSVEAAAAFRLPMTPARPLDHAPRSLATTGVCP